MPNVQTIAKKEAAVTSIADQMKKSIAGVLVDYKGISVEKDAELRRELRSAGVEYTVIKNGILRRASEQIGYDDLSAQLVGPTALAFSESDPVAAARIIAKYSKELNENFNIKAGFIDGRVIDANEVTELSKIPSKEVLIAKMLGSLNAPISNLAIVLNQIAELQQA